jgi:ABC-type branched-subunit amino acid transport system ATPase component
VRTDGADTAVPLLEVRNVTKRFDGLTVIDDVSFAVTRGEKTALLGPNGAGKTMLFNVISGIYPTTAGSIRLNSVELTSLPSADRVRHGLARTFQNIRLMGHLTALENVLLGQHHRARPFVGAFDPLLFAGRNRWKREALDGLAAAGLAAHAHTSVRNLPFGIRKQIELVRAMLARPALLLLDEPAAGLNPLETHALETHLEAISEAGVTLLVIEHDMEFVGGFCGRVIALNFGRKIADGTPDEVRSLPEVRQAYLGLDTASDG